MNNLNYKKFIQSVHSTSGLNESDESGESGESDYSNDNIIYEEDTTSLLNTSYNYLKLQFKSEP